ncbi:hypothetical protein ACK2J6_001222 [Vibrio fluvialis]
MSKLNLCEETESLLSKLEFKKGFVHSHLISERVDVRVEISDAGTDALFFIRGKWADDGFRPVARVFFCGHKSDDSVFKYARFHMDDMIRGNNVNSENDLLEFADRALTHHQVNRVIYTLLRQREWIEDELLRLSGGEHE